MACAPCLVRLMAIFKERGHVDSGCVGDRAHAARRSDHNPDASGYAHAQDIHEKRDHDMQPYVDFIMANRGLFPQVKYLIYEGYIRWPQTGTVKVYTGPNAHASHLHLSIFADQHHYAGSWYVEVAYSQQTVPIPTPSEEEEVKPYVIQVAQAHHYVVQADAMFWLASSEVIKSFTAAFGPAIQVDADTFERMKLALNSDVEVAPA